ncbi:MAG: hypothetical protein JNL92_13320 [Opitutaceae bacterium]|nr:hypothetical protein [Opitutaceae bacterium]
MGTFPPVEPKDPAAVTAFVLEHFNRMFPGENTSWLQTVFRDAVDLFEGRNPDYGPIDLHYHDLEHTLQATVCIALLLATRHAAGVVPRISRREFELAVAAALLHDSGYLKLRSDRSGTGAKYTYCHVLRSCAFAATYLPTRGANELEIEVVLGAISCTGPTREINQMHFREPIGRVIGNALATADFLGQMADPAYPDKLAILFREFYEADEFFHLALERRTFKSPADLAQRTPAFWENFVRRKLEVECQALYRFLASPYPHGPNPYIDAVERNVAEIRRRTAAAQPTIVSK